MSDIRGKRKYAGAPINELRKVDQDPMRLPPHKKPKVWKLTVEWTETRIVRREREFTSRAARDESRRRIERHLVEEAKKSAIIRARYRHWWPTNSPFMDYSDETVNRIVEGPKYIEFYGDEQPPVSGEKP